MKRFNPRQINPDTGFPVLSGDELSETECKILCEWLRSVRTNKEHPEVLALIGWCIEFFDFSFDEVVENILTNKNELDWCEFQQRLYDSLSSEEKIKMDKLLDEKGLEPIRNRAIVV